MSAIETKSLTIELKAAGENVIEAYAATFNGVDSYGDTIRPGAFLKTVAERGPQGSKKIRVLTNHESWQMPVGVPLAMTEDSFGLLTSTKMSQTQMGRDVYTLAQEGAINELSIGYSPVKFAYADEKVTGFLRELNEVKLFEYSFLTLLPADERAIITSVKSMADLERLLAQAKAIAEVDLQAKAGRVLSGANARKIQAALKELQDLLTEAGVDEAASDGTSGKSTSEEKGNAEPPAHSPLLSALQKKASQLDTDVKKGSLLADLRKFGQSLGGNP